MDAVVAAKAVPDVVFGDPIEAGGKFLYETVFYRAEAVYVFKVDIVLWFGDKGRKRSKHGARWRWQGRQVAWEVLREEWVVVDFANSDALDRVDSEHATDNVHAFGAQARARGEVPHTVWIGRSASFTEEEIATYGQYGRTGWPCLWARQTAGSHRASRRG